MQKPRLNFWQIWNMSFGFMGIQFGWGLQLANMSGIYTYLGASPDDVPLLWLAGPMTGLLVQPIVGSMSDRTWNRLGRRRPYFLVGAILASVALFFMPDSSALWMAAGLLWILDASINISMEPFRAFVADKLNVDQRTAGFVMQSFFIGVGASLANALPYFFRQLGVTGTTPSGIPLTVQYSFKIGAVVFLVSVLWTIFTTKEFPPENMAEFDRARKQTYGSATGIAKVFRVIGELGREISNAFTNMPQTMKQLAAVQIFTWLGLFCMWMFFGLTTSYHVFGASSSSDPRFALRSGMGRERLRCLFHRHVCHRLPAAETRRGHQSENGAHDRSHLRRHRAFVGLLHSGQMDAALDDGRCGNRLGVNPVDALRNSVGSIAGNAHGRLHGHL